ncbi:MAG: HAD family phosphatase [Acidobacteriaceae bacterium]
MNTSNQKIPIQVVIFDYGQVLARPPLRSDVESMAAIFKISTQRFEELYWRPRLTYDRGDLDVVSYWTEVAVAAAKTCDGSVNDQSAAAALTPAMIENLVEIDTQSWSRPDEATVRWATQLRQAGLELAVLSNMPLELSRNLVGRCQWLSVFERFIFSCDVRAVKPEAAIYQVCLDEVHSLPGEVLFLDDRQENVDGAIRAGMNSVLFDNLEGTMERVASTFDLRISAQKLI